LEKVHFYYFSRGSLTETQSHLDYGQRVGYFEETTVRKLDMELDALHNDLNRLIRSLKSSSNPDKGRRG